ncbi:hypothetical protein DSC45_12930 [Streptomyces sp. YIM 130001]|uniref:hypothetical protein n=1 Tax=Streptomyces sp. YIM 130001 TaxID=2259644 RepID=UPI000E64A5FC|nr:hypothetical protein [Streptomyces sp. YIM 130001]RII17800.1 hypothetical protein DSC45_12930 [Streptomyces sp. YIM 130001]
MTGIRLKHSAVLARMLLVFFRRRVLRAGVFKSASVRAFAAMGAALLLAAMCAGSYFFLRPLTGETAVWQLLFNTATASLVLWVQIAFLLVKVLFINAEGMLQLSYQLPVTNRERSAAFLMYEAAMTAVVAAAGLVSLAVSALILLGPSATGYIVASIVLPAALTYLILSAVYQVLTRLWILVGLSRMAGLLNVLALFALLAYYSTQMTAIVQDISGAYLRKETAYTWVTSVSWAWNTHGPLLTLIAAPAACALLLVLAFALAPNQHIRQSRFLKLPGSVRLRGVLGPYDWCLLRSAQTVAAAAMALALFGYLLLAKPSVTPLWGLAALSFGGLYQFTATHQLRLLPGAQETAWRVYVRLIRAQLILLAVFAVPTLAIATALRPGQLAAGGVALAACAGGAVMTTCISIVFPAEKDNPFSVFLGLSVVMITAGVTVIGLGLLRLPPWAVVVSLTAAAGAFVWYAIQGIHSSEARRRNVQGTVGSEVRRRGRGADDGECGGDTARAHVLDGH